MSKIVIVLPTYNEAGNIIGITAELLALNIRDRLEILVIDDASPDGTGQIADDLARQRPGRIYVSHRHDERGLGAAYIQGFTWALNHGADYMIQMDADFSHSPGYIPRFLELIRTYDVVVVSRYVAGGKVDERWWWGRKFLSWWANSVWGRYILGIKTKDATSGFKCWRRDALEKIGLENIHSDGYAFMVETCYLSEKLGLQIAEIPIYFKERRIGQSKMSLRIQLQSALRVLEIRWRHLW